MFHSAKDLLKYTIQADDMSADAEDMFVDTPDLKLRHVVVDIGPWFQNRSAVVSAARFGAPDTVSRDWPADLTKDEAESAPGLDSLPTEPARTIFSRMGVALGSRSRFDSRARPTSAMATA